MTVMLDPEVVAKLDRIISLLDRQPAAARPAANDLAAPPRPAEASSSKNSSAGHSTSDGGRLSAAQPLAVTREGKPRPTAEPAAGNGDPWQAPPDNSKATALSDAAAAVGRTLFDPFTQTDLQARLDGDNALRRAYSWIAAWKAKGWIDTVGFGTYRRTDAFGKGRGHAGRARA